MKRGLAVVLLVAVACTSGSSSSSSSSSSSPATAAYTPVFAKEPCTNTTEPRIECGKLTVPEDRTKPDGRKVVMPVAIVHTADPNPAPDPVLYLSGGPGDSALKETNRFLTKGQTGNRDVILLDQRGTGGSEPVLDCPEATAALRQVIGAAASFEAEATLARTALFTCRDRLRAAGIDLNQYNSAAVADDIADLRVAMGIKEWNLFGVSYGTMTALVTMRAHPEGIRSVVLDSAIPPDVGSGAPETAASFERARRVLLEGCARDAVCGARYPNLGGDLDEVVAKFNATPFTASVTDPTTQQQVEVEVTGADVNAGLFVALYDSELIGQLPAVIQVLKSDSAGIVLNELVVRGLSYVDNFAVADAAAVNCFDRAAFIHEGDDVRIATEKPDTSTLLLFTTVSCKDLGISPAPDEFNDAVTSDIPTLVLAGEYDPVTPSDQSRHTADSLPNSTFVLFPAMGHAEVFAAPECPEIVFRAFLAAPTAPVDTSCVAAMGPPDWT